MFNERKIIALKFQQFAETFKKPCSPQIFIQTVSDAGKMIVEAYRRNFFVHPRLTEIVERFIDDPPPPNPQAVGVLASHPANVFFHVTGNHEVHGILCEHGIEIIGPTQGGLIPEMYPGIINGWPIDESATRENPHLAFCCDLLAEIVEYGDQAEACDKFCYQSAMRGIGWQIIVNEANETRVWTVGSINHAKQCAARYAEKHNLKTVPIRPRGRQKKLNK